jgi:membrane fusion protein (multidrug efflux system)
VTSTRTFGHDWVVTAGLAGGEKVITQGTANLRPGAQVKAIPASTPQRVEPQAPGAQGGSGTGKAGSSGRPAGPQG